MVSKEIVAMEDLRVGDVIMTVEDDKLVETVVIGFLDRRKTAQTLYMVINVGDSQLKISKTHVVFVLSIKGNMVSKFAKDVQVGEHVTISQRSCLQTSEITGISWSHHVGAYVPLTDRGTILVDGVLVSCYTNVDHSLAHVFFAPVRWASRYLDLN